VELVVEVDERWVSPSWDAFQAGGVRHLRRLLARRVASAAAVLDVFALAYRGALVGSRALRAVVRVAVDSRDALLASSGQDGVFLRSLFRTEEERLQYGVVWLNVPLADALAKTSSAAGAYGLVRNARWASGWWRRSWTPRTWR
jgi:hypothetical protein